MRLRDLGWGAALVLALSVRFAVETALVNRLPAALAVGAAVVPAAAALVLLAWRAPDSRAFERDDRLLAASVGVGGVWLAPLLVASVRGTDSPPGAEVLFLTTAVWGLLLVLGGFVATRRTASPVGVGGALLGVTGAVGILANWERPSSFSPFIRYPVNEAVMLAAGVLWVLAVIGLRRLVRRYGAIVALRSIAVPAGVAALVGALVLGGRDIAAIQPSAWPFGLIAAAATFGVLLAWATLLQDRPPQAIAAAYLLPPVVLTGLTFVERATRVYGPSPIVVAPAVAGIVVSCFAAAVVIAGAVVAGQAKRSSVVLTAARAIAALAVLAAVAGLVMPDLAVSVTGEFSSGAKFAAQFVMSGLETVGGWLAACCSLLVLAWAWSREAVSRRVSALLLVTVALSAAAWLPLHTTPTHAWTSWIPAEVQQDFGTEYASRTVRPTRGPWEPAALALAVLAALLLMDRRASDGNAPRGTEVSKA